MSLDDAVLNVQLCASLRQQGRPFEMDVLLEAAVVLADAARVDLADRRSQGLAAARAAHPSTQPPDTCPPRGMPRPKLVGLRGGAA